MRNFTQEYQYDEIGNLLQMKSNGVWTRDYKYNFATNNYLLKHNENPTINSYEYDAHGNTTKMPHLQELKYDYADQLNEVTLNASGNKAYYIYNAGGERVRKVIVKNNIIEERFYLGDYEVYTKKTNGTLNVERETLHINDDTKKIVLIETKTGESAVIRYQHDNHLGSASLELDKNAEIISYEEYHPFGTTSYRSGRSETETSLKRYKYVGKERDEETGLYYYGARFYDAQLGRWHVVDPMAEERTWVSPYQYAQNNPINRIDPDGMLDDGRIIGPNQIEAYQDIQKAVDGELVLNMDADGNLSYERQVDGPLSEGSQKLVNLIDDKTTVSILDTGTDGVPGKASTGGVMDGGAYMGNKFNSEVVISSNGINVKKTVVGTNEVDIPVLSKAGAVSGNSGAYTLHEITEVHAGCKLAQKLNAEQPNSSINYGNYLIAHNNASPQPSTPLRNTYQDAKGNYLPLRIKGSINPSIRYYNTEIQDKKGNWQSLQHIDLNK